MTTLADTLEETATPKAHEVADWVNDKLGVADPATREDAQIAVAKTVGWIAGVAIEKAIPFITKLAGRDATPAAAKAKVPTAAAATVNVNVNPPLPSAQ